MAVYKVKRFNQPAVPNQQPHSDQPTAKELQMEQMKLQRQLLITQRAREKARQQERESKIKHQLQAQRVEQKKEQDENKRIIQAQKMSNQRQQENNDAMPPHLVKGRTKASETYSVNK